MHSRKIFRVRNSQKIPITNSDNLTIVKRELISRIVPRVVTPSETIAPDIPKDTAELPEGSRTHALSSSKYPLTFYAKSIKLVVFRILHASQIHSSTTVKSAVPHSYLLIFVAI